MFLVNGEKTEAMPLHLADRLVSMAGMESTVEICGFVLKGWGLLPVPNSSRDPGNSFDIAPDTLMSVLRQRRHDILGLYHSHPSGNHAPSETDLKGWPTYRRWRYWIVTRSSVHEWERGPGGVKQVWCL